MRDLSETARALVVELPRQPSRIIDLIVELGRTSEPAAIPYLAPFVTSKVSDVANAARTAIDALFRDVPPEDLPWLDQTVRQMWRSREITDPAPALAAVATAPKVLSFHPSGYVREAAVKNLSQSNDGSELPFLLLRSTDWVEQVRNAALPAVIERIRENYLPHLTRAFPLIARALQPQLVEPLTRLLDTPPGQSAVIETIAAGSRHTARAIFDWWSAGLRPASSNDPIIEAATTAPDEIVRSKAVRFASEATLRRLVTEPSPSVRRQALTRLAERPLLENAILDRSASVRETARFLLRDAHLDFARIYRDAIAANHDLAVAITGLSETGIASDAATILPHAAHPTARVRRAAVKALIRLDGAAHAETVVGKLLDPSPAVSAAARDALRPHAPLLGAALLQQLFDAAATDHARVNVVRLMASLPKWQSITCLLRAASAPDAAPIARHWIARWTAQFNRSHARPTRQELDDLANALSTADLDEQTIAIIRFGMKPFVQAG